MYPQIIYTQNLVGRYHQFTLVKIKPKRARARERERKKKDIKSISSQATKRPSTSYSFENEVGTQVDDRKKEERGNKLSTVVM